MIFYSSIEEYFDFDLGLVYNENVEDVTDDPKEWDKFWSTVDDEDGQQRVTVVKVHICASLLALHVYNKEVNKGITSATHQLRLYR